jgi:hypothetical protein
MFAVLHDRGQGRVEASINLVKASGIIPLVLDRIHGYNVYDCTLFDEK